MKIEIIRGYKPVIRRLLFVSALLVPLTGCLDAFQKKLDRVNQTTEQVQDVKNTGEQIKDTVEKLPE